MRFIGVILLLLVLGCARTPEEIQSKIDALILRETDLKQKIQRLRSECSGLSQLQEQAKELREEIRVLEYQKNGGTVEYVLELTLKQDRNLLDYDMKDGLNTVNFEFVTDRANYNRCKIGTELLRRGRKGSAMLEGSYSDWLIEVHGKHINML